MQFKVAMLSACICLSTACVASEPDLPLQSAAAPTRPTDTEATDAIIAMFGNDLLKGSTAKLGTCIPALEAEHAGQVACTVAVISAGGSSETQADFYRDGGMWVAQPSASQEALPFPDPAL